MELDPVLLEVLACPDDHHSPLLTGSPNDPDADALTCSSCGRVFPVRDGIPIMLLGEAAVPGATGSAMAGPAVVDQPEGSAPTP